MNLGFLQEESPKHLEILLEEQWVRFKHHWQKDSHVSLNSDKYKDWYRRVRLKNSMRLKPQQRLERVELEFCGSEALGPQDNNSSLPFQLANDLFLKLEVNMIASAVIKVCHTNCVGSKRKRDDICTVKFACSVAEAAALLVRWQPQTALSIFSALLNCWPVIALLPAINVLSCVPALPGRDLGHCMARSLTVAKNEGRAPSYVQLALNILSTQPHRLVRFLPLSVLCGDDKELLEVLRFVRRSLYRCTKSLESGLMASVLRTCDGCYCYSNPMNERSSSNSAANDEDDDQQPPLYGGIISERYAAVKLLLLIVGGIGGNNLCDFAMRCAMRIVSRSLKFFNPGFSQQQQSLSHVLYSLDVIIGILEYCPLKSDTLQDTICFLINLAIKEYENISAPVSSSLLDYSRGLNKEDLNHHRRQWFIIRRALSISLLKLTDRQFLYFKSKLAIVFDVDELSEEEEKALSIDELMLEKRLVDLQIIRPQQPRQYYEENRQRLSSSSSNSNLDNNDNDKHSLAKSKSTTINRFEEKEDNELVEYTVASQESLTCVLSRKLPKCLAFIERAIPLKRRPTGNASSSKTHENAESFHCIIGEENSSPCLSILRDGSFPVFILELVLDFLAPKRICRASCVCALWRCVCSSPPCRIWAKQFERRWSFKSFSELNEWLRARVRPPVTFVETSALDLSSGRMFPMGYIKVDWLMMFRQRWISEMKARRGRKGLLVCPWFNCASLIQDGKMFKRHLYSAHNVQLDDNMNRNVNSSKRRTA